MNDAKQQREKGAQMSTKDIATAVALRLALNNIYDTPAPLQEKHPEPDIDRWLEVRRIQAGYYEKKGVRLLFFGLWRSVLPSLARALLPPRWQK